LIRIAVAITAVLLAAPLSAAPAWAQDDPGLCAGVEATIVGTAGDDVIVGTDGDDLIVGLAGNDRITGGLGRDMICGGDGTSESEDADVIDAGPGEDFVLGGAGPDRILLGDDSDYAESGPGNDDVRGSVGDDYVDTGTGEDFADGGPGRDYVTAGEGDDTLRSPDGPDYLDGGMGQDVLLGGTETDYADGGEGDDRITSASGYIDGGAGTDVITGGASVPYVEAGPGSDVVESAAGYLDGGPGDDVLTATGPGAEFLSGGDGADQLYGRAGADTLSGGSGDDILEGGAGPNDLWGGADADTLHGRGNDDSLDGGEGPDELVGGAGADAFDGGPGTDILRAADGATDSSFRCGPLFENDRLVADTEIDDVVERSHCERERNRIVTMPPPPPPRGSLYVALGDSFSSGEGTFLYDNELGAERCHRGALSWPRHLGTVHLGLQAEHRACSGATTWQLRYAWSEKLQDPQIHDEPQTRTELVTFTIGGNDVGFAKLLVDVRKTVDDFFGPAANRKGTEQAIRGKLQELAANLTVRYKQLRAAYPGARIVHVGYPRILPLPEQRPYRCKWLGKKERDMAEWVTTKLNATIRTAAESSRYDIEYADVTDALAGHELCTTDPWMNDLAIELEDLPGFPGEGSTERGHPNLYGQKAYSDAVWQAISG